MDSRKVIKLKFYRKNKSSCGEIVVLSSLKITLKIAYFNNELLR